MDWMKSKKEKSDSEMLDMVKLKVSYIRLYGGRHIDEDVKWNRRDIDYTSNRMIFHSLF